MIISARDLDITSSINSTDKIVFQSTKTQDGSLQAFGRQADTTHVPSGILTLGNILSFRFDCNSLLHLIVCYEPHENGWHDTHSYLRYGLDTLWMTTKRKVMSIVDPGNYNLAENSGTSAKELQQAIQETRLQLRVYNRFPKTSLTDPEIPLSFVKAWTVDEGIYRPPS